MALYQDGNFPAGTEVLTINSVDYVTDSFNYNSGTAEVANIKDENGDHAGANSSTGPGTGSAVLQLATSSTAIPTSAAENSTTGVFTFSHDGANVDAFITSADLSKPQAPAPWTVSINFQGKVN